MLYSIILKVFLKLQANELRSIVIDQRRREPVPTKYQFQLGNTVVTLRGMASGHMVAMSM